MFNIKLEEKLYKMSFKALPVKMQRSKNRQPPNNVPPSRADRVKQIIRLSSGAIIYTLWNDILVEFWVTKLVISSFSPLLLSRLLK